MPVPNSTSDSNKFPIESCRERIARRYGLEAVALSGPCKGAPLCDCVCKELSDRWDNVSNRFAKNEKKVVRLAEKLAGSFMEKDDSDEAVKAIGKMGFEAKAASNIAGYLHAYAMPDVLSDEINTLSDEVDQEEQLQKEPVMDEALGIEEKPLGGDPLGEPSAPPVEGLVVEPLGAEKPLGEGLPGEGLTGEGLPGGEMVEISIPADVAQELKSALEVQAPPAEGGLGEPGLGEPSLEMETVEDEVVPEEPVGPPAEEPAKEPTEEVTELSEEPKEEVVPGEPEAEKEEHVVESKPAPAQTPEGVKEKVPAKKAEPKAAEQKPENKEASVKGIQVKVAYPEFGSGNKPISEKSKQVEDPKPVADGNLKTEGHAAGDNKMNDNKTMGAEQKFDAKTVDKSDVSGGSKSIIGKDESFPEGKPSVPAGSAPIGGEELTGGDVSTKGTVIATVTPKGIMIETPEGKKFLAKAEIKKEHAEEVAKQIAEIKYEGDGAKFAKAALAAYKKFASSKNHVQATITPKGVAFKTPEGKSFMAKVTIASKPSEKMIKAVEEVAWEGDVQKFANGLLKAVKTAEKSDKDETKTDTSAKEAKDFTNDAEKKPEDDKATKEGKQAPKNDEGQTKTDTAKLEAEKFTNDAEKKPDTSASSTKEVKQAADKALKNGPISEGNFDAKDKTVMDGGKGMGAEENFKAASPEKTSGGEKSVMGKDEELPKGEFKVPSEDSDTNTMIKGTIIAQQNEAKLREARLKAASIYVADLLRNNEINENEYNETLEKVASMPIQAIQQLAMSTKKSRERVAKAAEAMQKKVASKEVGLGLPVVISSKTGTADLTQRLADSFTLTQKCNDYDAMKNGK